MKLHTTDVIIIGGGVIGLAIARKLAQANQKVALFERNAQPGGEASWAAAGMLAPQAEAAGPGVMLDLCLASRALYRNFASSLQQETGIDVELRTEGTLLPTFAENPEPLRKFADWQQKAGLRAEFIAAEETRRREPHLSERITGAVWLPDDWQVDNRRLTRALIAAVYAAGVEIHCNAANLKVCIERDRVTGVEVGLERWSAPVVVNAAGSWAAQMPRELLRLPQASVRPIRGQMLALDMQPPTLLRHVIRTEQAYLVPRRDGRLVIGATVEDGGYEKTVTAGGVAALLNGAIEVVPRLAQMPLLETWAGLRPLAEDQLPILGETDLKGLFCATGHYRNGILLTPITAEIIASLIVGEDPAVPVASFSPRRFSA
ncbi:MAG: glycine oxidase ThiO [Blastocatellia bacterium]|nr:glycine oxidase ThiO [Blastocatellia bacterium]